MATIKKPAVSASAAVLADLRLLEGTGDALATARTAHTNKADALAEDLGKMLKGLSGEQVDSAIAALEAEVAADPVLGEKNKKGSFVIKAAPKRHLERAIQAAIKDHGVQQSEVRKAKSVLAAAKAAQSKIAKAAQTLGVSEDVAKAETFKVSANQRRLIELMLTSEAVEIAFTRMVEAASKGSKSYGINKEMIEACKPAKPADSVAAQLGAALKAA